MKLAVTTVLILAFLASAKTLECYLCHSDLSPGCGRDEFSPVEATTMTCAAGEVCGKVFDGENVGRGCIHMEEDNNCFAMGLSSTSVEFCFCSNDLCNSGLSNNLGLVLAFIAFLAAKYL